MRLFLLEVSVTVLQDVQGPDWPLGSIAVAVPGTPVSIMSLVDPSLVNDPANPVPAVPSNSNAVAQYTPRANQIMIQGMKPGAVHGLQNNSGNLYIVRKGGSRDDTGTIIATVPAGQTVFLGTSAMVRDVWSPYRYYLDADNAGDCGQVTLLIF